MRDLCQKDRVAPHEAQLEERSSILSRRMLRFVDRELLNMAILICTTW